MAQPVTLAQLKAETDANAGRSLFGGIGEAIAKVGSALFGPPAKKGKGPPPKHEYLGCEVNLLSANKNAEGAGAGGGGGGPRGGGPSSVNDAWLAGMPGIK